MHIYTDTRVLVIQYILLNRNGSALATEGLQNPKCQTLSYRQEEHAPQNMGPFLFVSLFTVLIGHNTLILVNSVRVTRVKNGHIFSIPLSPRPSLTQIFSSTPYSQTPSAYVPPSTWATKFHTHTKPQSKLQFCIFYGITNRRDNVQWNLFLCKSTLHVSGGTHAHHQEYNFNCIDSNWYNS